MKKSGTTTTFVLVCVAVLIASYGIGLGIFEIRCKVAGAQTTAGKTEKPTNQAQIQSAPTERPAAGGPEATFNRRQRNRTTENEMGARPGFENMSEEDRAQMQERTGRRGGRRGFDFENMTEEERAAMEEQRQQMMERFQNMTEEERSQMRGGRGGRGGRRRGEMSDFRQGEIDFQSNVNESELSQNDVLIEEDDLGQDVNDIE